MKTVEQLAQVTNPTLVRAMGAVRRFVITLTDRALWQVAGVLMPDGREAHRSEIFGGIGFYARPPAGVEAEAIAVMVGDATVPTIVGVRDEATRAAVVGDIRADESAMYNSQALVYVKDDGTIEARSKLGLVQPTIRGTAYRTAEDALITAIQTAITAINAYAVAIKPIADPTNVATPVLTTALITTFQTAVAAFQSASSTYTTTVLKVE